MNVIKAIMIVCFVVNILNRFNKQYLYEKKFLLYIKLQIHQKKR